MTTHQRIVIVGGGLVGSLMSMLLVRRGHSVSIYEQRPDMRSADISAGRSINLIATSRGRAALAAVGLLDVVTDHAVSVRGRMMHAVDGSLSYHAYGKDDSEANHSVSRGELNKLLLAQAEKLGVEVFFQHRFVGGQLQEARLEFEDEGSGQRVEVSADHVIGADGAGSRMREELVKQGHVQSSFADLGHGYKELEIPANADGSFRLESHALHIWPRGHHMMMALPNERGTFTVTLYLPQTGEPGFDTLTTLAHVQELFEKEYADAIPLIPGLLDEYFANPTGRLGTVRCAPWHVHERALLIGDAAHAIVPFFGQGMNCGFEDCMVLDGLLAQHGDDWGAAFAGFTEARKPNGDAVADMSLENFVEMRDHVGDPHFMLRKQVEHRLENELVGKYRTRYSMVTYSHIPYALAQQIGRIQSTILDELCMGITAADELDLARARSLIDERFTPYLEKHSVKLDY